MQELTCADCGTSWTRDTATGRPPKRCPDCIKRAAAERDRKRQRTYSPTGRQNAAPCAGGCGKSLWGSSTSLPAGERTCRGCRSSKNLTRAAGGEFTPGNMPGRHGKAWRKLRAQVVAEEADCYRCGAPVDKSLKWPDPDSPSADHVKDIREGGAPLDRDNVRLAHFGCNSADGARKRHARQSGDAGRHLAPTRAREAVMAAGRVAGDETRDFLTMIREKLASEMNQAVGAESAVIAKELRAVVAALAELDRSATQGGSILDQLAARRATRLADAAGQ